MPTFETKLLILRGGNNKWDIIPKSLGESVGEVRILNEWSGFVTFEIVFDEDWRYGFTEEVLKEIVRYYFEETVFHTVKVKNADIEKELRSCGFRPQIRGHSDCGFSINKNKIKYGKNT